MKEKISVSIREWRKLNISSELIISELKYPMCYFKSFTEWDKIQTWVQSMWDWRSKNIKHKLSRGALIGIYGELFAAAYTIKNVDNFEKWLSTIAIDGYGDNTNRDLKKEWTGKPHDIEVKTVGKSNDRISSKDDKRKFVYPEMLMAVKEVREYLYVIHSITPKKQLEKICKIYPEDNHKRYVFKLNQLDNVRFTDESLYKYLVYVMGLNESKEN